MTLGTFKKASFDKTRLLVAACLSTTLLLMSCAPSPPSGIFETEAESSRFLGKATFGATSTAITDLTGANVSDWMRAEFEKPATKYLPSMLAEIEALPDTSAPVERPPARSISDGFVEAAIIGDDQLRQRMVLALSEIIVVSYFGDIKNYPAIMAEYMDVLSDNAFGNYRDLLEEITYTPAMGFYLTYIANQKGDPDTGRVPDENYARELLQLFTIGLTELNMDGTEILDAKGQAKETYDNTDITGLAKVFTGLSWDHGDFFNTRGRLPSAYGPMKIYPQHHSNLEKTFLDFTIPANTDGEASIDMALDAVFAHPNVAPFVSRQLIQRFVSSNPDPAYVERVATAFEEGAYVLPDGLSVGTGQRGDLKATIAAVLLDKDALRDPAMVSADSGKIREPFIRFVNWARAFNETTPDVRDEKILIDMSTMGQHPFNSPSVFNFFRPGYVASNTETGAAGLTAPELQVINESSAIAYVNFINAFIYDTSPNLSGDKDGGVKADYSAELAIADDGQALIDRLDLLLTGNSLGAETRARMLEMMDEIPIRPDTEDEDRLSRVTVAVTMVMAAPGYLVQR